MEHKLQIINAHIFTPFGNKAVRGKDMANIREIPNASILAENGIITYVGSAQNAPALPEDGSVITIDAKGRAVIPGFVDSHTHMIFGGWRDEEFSWRLKGDTYMSIMERGGGINSTVTHTREATEEQLIDNAKWLIHRMEEMGVTTVEAKSGYGLNISTEEKMLHALSELASDPTVSVDIVPTFMAAHAVPKEYAGRTSEYVDLIIHEMIPIFKDKAKFFDVFTEKNVFEIEDSRRLLLAAKKAGMQLKIHADEIVQLGGAELAAEVGAISADHLLHASDAGIKAMAEAGVVATLLPLTAFALREQFAPARKFIDAGAAVALATDLNPGSCFSGSIPLTIALACIHMNMTIEETLAALTINGAAALDMADSIGSIEVGKRADINILHFDSIKALPYYVGMNCIDTVICKGKAIYSEKEKFN